MHQFSRIFNKYNLNFNKKINRFCNPILNQFGVNHFWYYKVTYDGQYTCLGSNLSWTEYYFSEKLYLPNPYLRTPENYQTGVSFIRQIKDNSYQTSLDVGVKNFNINQSLIFLEKNQTGVEGFGFASYLPTDNFESLCINEMLVLKFFVKKFREEFKGVLLTMSEDLVDIASIVGPSFYDRIPDLKSPSIDRTLILKQYGLERILELSKREKRGLISRFKGTASQPNSRTVKII